MQVSAALHARFGRSLKLRSVSAGGCNACELEVNALSNVNFDIGRYGIDVVASPRHADALVLTGPISRNMAPALQTCWDAIARTQAGDRGGRLRHLGQPFRDPPGTEGSPALDRDFSTASGPACTLPAAAAPA